MEARLSIQCVKIGADDLAVFHAAAAVVDKVWHPARWVDVVVGTANAARFGLDDANAMLEALFQDQDPSQPRVRGGIRNVEFHRLPVCLAAAKRRGRVSAPARRCGSDGSAEGCCTGGIAGCVSPPAASAC